MSDLDDDLSVDLTPLIDVIFMLVIFFIMTMSFTLPSLSITLPQAESAELKRVESTALQISIDKAGTLLYKNAPLSYAELKELLEEGTFKSLAVSMDANAPAQSLIDMADLARLYTQGAMSVTALNRHDVN